MPPYDYSREEDNVTSAGRLRRPERLGLLARIHETTRCLKALP